MFVGARMTAEPTFHKLYVKVAVSLLYSTHQFLTHYHVIELRLKYPLIQTQPRSENRNYMSTIHTTVEQHKFVAVKGSPTEVVQICKWWLKNGQLVPLTEEDRQAIEIENDRMAGKALRVLGVAYAHSPIGIEDINDLTWLGLVGMADPIRAGARELMRDFHQAGINTTSKFSVDQAGYCENQK